MATPTTAAELYPSFQGRRGMVIDATMQTVFAALFAAATGAIGWLIGKLWTDRGEMQAKLFAMLEAQFTDANRRKDLFDELGKAIDGQAQATRDLRQEFANLRSDIQRSRP